MHALVLPLGGFLVGIGLLWATLFWVIRLRPRRVARLRAGDPTTAVEMIERWRANKP